MAFTTINKSSDYFNTKLYTGNATGRTISGVGFQPDWSWIKNRSDTSGHRLLDAVRGATKELISNATNSEATEAQSLQSWNSDGFVLGTAAGVNANTNNFVSWNWKANGTGSANTDGDINSTVSANTTSGFSIVKYTGNGSSGATVGHGLGSAVKMVICKDLTNGQGWKVWNINMTAGNTMSLNTTTAQNSDTNRIASANATTFTTSGTYSVNESGEDYIAYCFADVQGYSKFNSFVGNANADGTFVYTGFKPTWILLRNRDSAQDWQIYTWDMQPYNEFCTTSAGRLKANTADAQSTKSAFDMLSNGFKMRTDASDINGSGNTILYMAFADAPLVGTNNVPATAR